MTNDLISRKALRNQFASECPGDCSSCDYSSATNGRLWCGLIDDAPAVDAAPVVHGRWGDYVCVGYNGLKSVWARPCSECGYENQAFATKYRPNFGAMMRGKSDESE